MTWFFWAMLGKIGQIFIPSSGHTDFILSLRKGQTKIPRKLSLAVSFIAKSGFIVLVPRIAHVRRGRNEAEQYRQQEDDLKLDKGWPFKK